MSCWILFAHDVTRRQAKDAMAETDDIKGNVIFSDDSFDIRLGGYSLSNAEIGADISVEAVAKRIGYFKFADRPRDIAKFIQKDA